MQNRDPKLETSGKIIGFYEREFYCLSNFSSFAVNWKNIMWPTSEHAYQAAHFIDTDKRLFDKIVKARSAHDAYKIAKANADKAPKNWHDIKIGVMEEILIATGHHKIVEDSPKDEFWGWGQNHNGRNELGKLWMKLRDEIIN